MIAILSPSKTQDFESELIFKPFTEGRFHQQSWELAQNLREYSADELSELMSISENLGNLNHDRYQAFEKSYTEQNSRQSILAFKGDVYTHIQVDDYTAEDFEFAQKHIRTISGLYGLLRPLDRIQTYRLEMKTALKNEKGKNLYQFWGDTLMKALEQDLAEQEDRVVINLASKEYSKALRLDQIDAEVINIVFKEKRPGKEPAILALFAKLARGMMANYMVKERLSSPEQLKNFDQSGYEYRDDLSKPDELVFVRTQSTERA